MRPPASLRPTRLLPLLVAAAWAFGMSPASAQYSGPVPLVRKLMLGNDSPRL